MPELFIPALLTIVLALVSLGLAAICGIYLGVDHQRRMEGYQYDEEDDEDFLYNVGLCFGTASIIIILLTLAFVAP